MPKKGDKNAALPSTGRLSRGAIAGMAVARAGLAHLGHKAQSLTRDEAVQAQARQAHEAELGRILFAALNQLKGAALKASQLLSMELGFVPEGMREELARAHYQVTPLNRALVIKVLSHELGQDPLALFQQFDLTAFAAASLGQVHAATLPNGDAVAVKLQYPGMAASIGSDMRMLRSLLKTLGGQSEALPNAAIIERVMADLELKLAEELDYLHEAQSLLWFGQHLTLPGLVIPQPVMSHSTTRVLTMQRLPGQHLNEWLLTQPSQDQRDHYGQLLFDTFMHCCFVLHRLQADPHPGNFVFMQGGQLGLLDFGCTRHLCPDFCAALAQAWSANLRIPVDAALMQQTYRRMGLIDPALSEDDFCSKLLPALADVQTWQRLPFATPIYDFTQYPSHPGSKPVNQRSAVQFLQSVPADLPYFDRAFLGLTQLLKNLGARVRTSNPWIH